MRNVLVTGASGGIGAAVARAFAACGDRVILHYNRSAQAAKQLAAELPNAVLYQADLSDQASVEALAAAFPETDVLVNNAAVDLFSLFDLASEQQLRELYAVNLFAPLTLCRRLAPRMVSRGRGCIVNVSSVFGEIGGSCEVDYSVAKAALLGLTRALAKELGPSGVRVNCVCPGVIDTNMNARLTVAELEAITDALPIERMGKPEEVAASVKFLASDEAGYITGAVLDVNGGYI